MASTSQFDALQIVPLNLPFDVAQNPLGGEKILIGGHNMMCTPGGVLRKRPGLVNIVGTSLSGLRCDRLWAYETMEETPKVYILGSFYKASTGVWEMYYIRPGLSNWHKFPDLRDVNLSRRAHEVVVSRGLAYVKAFPRSTSAEKLGTVVFDGKPDPPTLYFWGILAPDSAARIDATVRKTAADVSSTDTTVTVDSVTGFPASPPYVILIDHEYMLVTAVSGTTLTVTRGYLNTPITTHKKNALVFYRNWTPSDHNVTVRSGWKYTVAYKTALGHVSCRAPLEENPTYPPSDTGPFFDQIPKLTIPGHSDTTQVPKLCVYRTTDGGGTFYFLEEVTNSGTSTQAYYDDSWRSGPDSNPVYNDPVPDRHLDTLQRAPTLVSNLPPPTVLLPKILGQDTPEESTRIVAYASRLWYAIGNVLFFSAQEELDEGIPEHAWPGGMAGNFFKFPEPVFNLEVTANSLWIFTGGGIYRLTGSNLETFSVRPVFRDFTCHPRHPYAVCAFRDNVAFMTADFRIAILSEQSPPVIVSLPLGDLIQTQADAGAEIQLVQYAEKEHDWLLVFALNRTEPEKTRIYAMNLNEKNPFWFTPWHIPAVCAVKSRVDQSPGRAPRLVIAISDGSVFRLGYASLSAPTDITIYGTPAGFDYSFTLPLFHVPAGNHINLLRRPAMFPRVQKIFVESTEPSPKVFYYKDSLTSPVAGTVESLAHIPLPDGYHIAVVPVDEVCYRVGVRIECPDGQADRPAEYYALSIVWQPEAGI